MKRGIITGSSRGIGLATVKRLLKNEDVKVIGTSTSGKHSVQYHNFKCFQLDLSDSESISNFVTGLKNKSIDFLVNNAAILLEEWNNPEVNVSKLKKTFDVNVFGTIGLTEKLLPFINERGHIVNITSSWGSFSEKFFTEFQPHYKMSKAALNMYTKLLAKRLEGKTIKVSSLDPGWTQTDMGGFNATRKPEEVANDIYNLLNNDIKSGQFWHKGEIRNW